MKPNMNKTKVMIGGESSKRAQDSRRCGICGRGEILAWFSVWSEVQMICIRSS